MRIVICLWRIEKCTGLKKSLVYIGRFANLQKKSVLVKNIFFCSWFSKHRPSGPMFSISWNVHVRVCLCVCVRVFTLRYRSNVFLTSLPKNGCQKCLKIRNSWGKEVVSDLNIFAQKWSKIAAAKKVFTDFSPLFPLHLNVFLPPLHEVQCKVITFYVFCCC